ncbi:Sigma-54 interaction domain-containing protein [Halodesulfovibrio aestuarii]|uniref:Sigma-54 interaction domain-containing protein n=1 Tax=Halodesulfovibrio aestuarii TaxID=126333 RepID=A0A8G2FAI6_9BACT|nr:Sigma-54 interaction domain-containing protein [Halodesulfovibrio aestuarii]
MDVRIIAAGNEDLSALVESNKFRSDLFYRLNVFPIEITPLRDHIEDISLLAEHMLNRLVAGAPCMLRLRQKSVTRLLVLFMKKVDLVVKRY